VANSTTSITASNATQTAIAAGLDAKAVASSAFTGRFSATGDSNLIITEKVGSGGADDVYTVGGITAASSVTMSGGSAGTLSGVLGANLSAYSNTDVTIDDTGVIAALDVAIVNVAAARADYGSKINRLEHTIDNLNSSVLNTTSAKSAIMDADYAAETTELARTQIISQASTAMLSQANQQAQSVLALLK
jgi:flagellin